MVRYLICRGCGEQDEFEQVVTGSCTFEEVHYLDGNGEVKDVEEQGTSDQEVSDEEDITCSDCGSYDLEEFKDYGEFVKYRIEHTDENQKWHEEVLSEDKRNKEILKESVAKEV